MSMPRTACTGPNDFSSADSEMPDAMTGTIADVMPSTLRSAAWFEPVVSVTGSPTRTSSVHREVDPVVEEADEPRDALAGRDRGFVRPREAVVPGPAHPEREVGGVAL